MNKFNIREAQAQMDALLKRVAAGEEIVIVKKGKTVARLVPFHEGPRPKRQPGSLRGKIKIKPGFYAADKEIEAMFKGEAE